MNNSTKDCLNLTNAEQNSILGLKTKRVFFGVGLCTILILRITFHGNWVIGEE